jgi:vacuolar-type H+-ATPase subunit I/STV1
MAKNTEQNNEVEIKQEYHVDSRIAAVRDLIFGENIQQYNTEFSDVYDKLKLLENQTKSNLAESVIQLENKLADLESLMDHKFQDLSEDLDKRLADLDDEKADRRKLGKALEKIALMLQE